LLNTVQGAIQRRESAALHPVYTPVDVVLLFAHWLTRSVRHQFYSTARRHLAASRVVRVICAPSNRRLGSAQPAEHISFGRYEGVDILIRYVSGYIW